MRLSHVLPGLFLLLVQCVVARISPYNPDDNMRPDNVTGLDYKYYSEIGTYYNGSFTISVSPMHRPKKVIFKGTTCEEFENKTFEVPLKAIAGFTEVAPKAPSVNPFFVNLNAWGTDYNLTNQYQTANYSEYEQFKLTSNNDFDGNATIYFNITNNDTALWYNFAGHMNGEFLRWQDFKFNTTGICDTTFEDDMLFGGSFLSPDPRVEYDWTENPIALPTVRGGFNENQAWMEMTGLFSAVSKSTELVGEMKIEFRGEVDKERSDQLFMGREKPVWNATLGFEGESAAALVKPAWTSSFALVGLLAVASFYSMY